MRQRSGPQACQRIRISLLWLYLLLLLDYGPGFVVIRQPQPSLRHVGSRHCCARRRYSSAPLDTSRPRLYARRHNVAADDTLRHGRGCRIKTPLRKGTTEAGYSGGGFVACPRPGLFLTMRLTGVSNLVVARCSTELMLLATISLSFSGWRVRGSGSPSDAWPPCCRVMATRGQRLQAA